MRFGRREIRPKQRPTTQRWLDRWYDQAIQDWQADEFGLLDPDQPTRTAHNEYHHDLRVEFSTQERVAIRLALGMELRQAGER